MKLLHFYHNPNIFAQDYCNSLLLGLLGPILNFLQFILHTVARLIFSKHKSDQFTEMLEYFSGFSLLWG